MKKNFSLHSVSRILFSLLTTTILTLSLGLTTTFAATYTVDTLTDSANDGECITDTTFRDAIACAAGNAGQDTIDFSVSGTITLTANGTDIAGGDVTGVLLDCDANIVFDGNSGTYDGLLMTAGASKIKGCTIQNMSTYSVYMDGDSNYLGGTADSSEQNYILDKGVLVTGDDAFIQSNFIGVTSGDSADGGAFGIVIDGGDTITIGGDTASERNIISGQSSCGISITATSTVGAVTIEGNYIGTNTTGTSAIGNGDGICFDNGAKTYASRINIGGNASGEENIIAGNTGDGIFVNDVTFSEFNILSNYIGVDSTGATALANGDDGIEFKASSCTTLGNCITKSNTISGNTDGGIILASGSTKMQLWGNNIGVNSDGNTAIGNGGSGIECNTCTDNLFGTSDTDTIDAPNVISGNGNHGIYINGSASSGNTISENYIGFDSAGSAVIANTVDGIQCNGCGSLTIGNSSTANIMNIIVGNTDDGIQIESNAGAVNVYANAIGATSADYGNGGSGIEISGTTTAAVTIGNTYATGGNIISGNTGRGIHINDSGSQSHVIKGNKIGTDKNGTAALGNDTDGILIQGSNPNITIGSATTGEYNVIGGNVKSGITVAGIAATIIGNYIGTNASYTDIGNTENGVIISNSATGVTLGYGFGESLTGLSKANYIGYNGGGSYNDVTLDGASTTTNALRGNVFNLSATDTSTNMSFNTGAQSSVSNSGTIINVATEIELSGTTDATAGGKMDFYTINNYTTSYAGTATIASGIALLSGSFTDGDSVYYQITKADGTSYPFASTGKEVDTVFNRFKITGDNGGIYATWDTVPSNDTDHFEIWYGQTEGDVLTRSGTATEWDNSDDANLTTTSTASTTITGPDVTSSGITWYAKIWFVTGSATEGTVSSAASYFTGVPGGSGSSSSTASSSTTQSSDSDDEDGDSGEESDADKKKDTSEDSDAEDTNDTEEEVVVDQTDTDNDGLIDVDEKKYGTDPEDTDSDNDGISDGKEVHDFGTNPLKIDTDGDGFSDMYELANIFTDPNDSCSPGDANASEEVQAECAKKIALKKIADEEAEEKATEEENEDEAESLPINEEIVEDISEDIEDEIEDEFEWMKRHFKDLLKIESIRIAYSNSEQIQRVMKKFIEEPELPITNGDAIAIATATFKEEAFKNPAIVNALNNGPFIEEGFRSRVLNKHVNSSFNTKSFLKRGSALRLMFRISGLRLQKQFGLSLFETFGVKTSIFSDVSNNNPALPYILFFQKKGLLQGYPDGAFRSSEFMSRGEFIKLVTLFHQEVQRHSEQ